MPGGHRVGKGLDARREFLRRVFASRNCTDDEAEAAVEKVHVRIDESGRDERAAEIDDLGVARLCLEFCRRSHGGDAVTGDRNGLDLRTLRVAGPDATVDEDERRGRSHVARPTTNPVGPGIR